MLNHVTYEKDGYDNLEYSRLLGIVFTGFLYFGVCLTIIGVAIKSKDWIIYLVIPHLIIALIVFWVLNDERYYGEI